MDGTIDLPNGGIPGQYPIYMALAHSVGYDRRGKTLFRREQDGTDIIRDVPILDPSTGKVIRTNKERIIANDLPAIVRDYLDFKDDLRKGKVHFNKSEGVYRVMA